MRSLLLDAICGVGGRRYVSFLEITHFLFDSDMNLNWQTRGLNTPSSLEIRKHIAISPDHCQSHQTHRSVSWFIMTSKYHAPPNQLCSCWVPGQPSPARPSLPPPPSGVCVLNHGTAANSLQLAGCCLHWSRQEGALTQLKITRFDNLAF